MGDVETLLDEITAIVKQALHQGSLEPDSEGDMHCMGCFASLDAGETHRDGCYIPKLHTVKDSLIPALRAALQSVKVEARCKVCGGGGYVADFRGDVQDCPNCNKPDMWEYFCDEGYYHLWAVRPKGENRRGHCFHVQSKEEAEGLCDLLNTLPQPPGESA